MNRKQRVASQGAWRVPKPTRCFSSCKVENRCRELSVLITEPLRASWRWIFRNHWGNCRSIGIQRARGSSCKISDHPGESKCYDLVFDKYKWYYLVINWKMQERINRGCWMERSKTIKLKLGCCRIQINRISGKQQPKRQCSRFPPSAGQGRVN